MADPEHEAHDPRLAPWQVDEKKFPWDGDRSVQARFLLRYAILAPSSHNTQPWKFHVDGERTAFLVDRERWLQVADPSGRELYTSVGCALENFLIAAEHFGLGHRLRCTDGSDDLAAEVTLLGRGVPSAVRPPRLFEAILERQTNRNRYQPRPVPGEILQNLQACSSDADIWLHRSDDPELKRKVDQLVVRADALQFADPAFREELAQWVRQGVFGTSWLLAKLEAFAIAHIDLGKPVGHRDHVGVMSAPVIALLASRQGDRASEVKTGQVFERIYLTAARLGIALQPLSQLVEIAEVKAELGALFPLEGYHPQQPFRLGFAEPEKGRSPRRPLDEVLLEARLLD